MSTAEQRKKAIETARASLLRMQEFDPASISREEDLGMLNFREAVPHAQRLVDLYRQLPVDALEWFSEPQATQLQTAADADYNILGEILKLNPQTGDPGTTRTKLIRQLEEAYDNSFQQLHQKIAYAVGRVTDFTRIGREARATIQGVEDQAQKLAGDMVERQTEAKQILEEIRRVAAEQGVSQQAIHFKSESEHHSERAAEWLKLTYWLTGTLAGYSILTLVLHRVSWLAPTTSYEAVQLGIGKFLVFVTLASLVVLSTRNFMAHRHNAVVNKHRQNALMTYRALVDAAGDGANRDIVLAKAAECIFSDQPTGFSRADVSDASPVSLVSMGPGAIRPTMQPG